MSGTRMKLQAGLCRFERFCAILSIAALAAINAGAWAFPYFDNTGKTVRVAPRGHVLIQKGADGYRYCTVHPQGPPKDAAGREWYDPAYDDSEWQSGAAPFGYGDEPRATYSTKLQSNRGSYFFRKRFQVKRSELPPDRVPALSVASDDAAIVYLNGKEVDRDPAFGHGGGHEFSYWNRQVEVPRETLRDGLNVIAVELGNPGSSSDAYLDLELSTPVPWLQQLDSLVEKKGLLFCFAQVGDPQSNWRYTEECVRQLNELAPDLVLFAGDLTELGTEEEFKRFKGIVSKLKVPYYLCPGNHDVATQPVDAYLKFFQVQRYYSFDHKGCHFVSLGPVVFKQHEGTLPDERLEWLRNDLAAAPGAQHAFVFCHFPLPQCILEGGGRKLYETLKTYRVTAYLAGHLHRHRRTPFADFQQITVNALAWTIDGTPEGYRLHFVYPDRVVSFYKAVSGSVIPASRIVAYNPRLVPESKVRTSIEEQSPFRFVVFGDTRTGHAIYRKALDIAKKQSPSFVINVGDIIEQPGNRGQWEDFMKMSDRFMKTIPYYAVPGNHDISGEASEALFKEFFTQPGNELYYSFRHHGSLFIVLASPRKDFRTAQFEWLKSELANAEGAAHTFIFMHHPLFGPKDEFAGIKGGGQDFRSRFHRLCVEHRVDVVFAGHMHLYHKRMVDDVLYVITGGGGAPLHTQSQDEGGFHHLVVVDVIGEALRMQTVQIDPVRDRLQIMKE